MDCPRCKLTLRKAEYEGVVVDRCEYCWGIWLDTREFPISLDPQSLRFSELERQQFPVRQAGPAEPRNTKPAACPRCGQIMERFESVGMTSLVVDRCPGHGVWLDTGEIHAAQVLAEQSAEIPRLLLRKLGAIHS